MTTAAKRSSVLWCYLIAAAILVTCVDVQATEGKLKQYTLDNGLRVLVKEDPERKVATIQLWVLVGSADEERSEAGISHLIEHMAFKGTEKRGVGQIAAEVESLGGETNAYTSWDETVFHVTVPSSKALQGLEILADAVLHPSIDPKELKKEKQVVIEEILEGEERPERKAGKLLFKTSYVRSPYKWPVIGNKKNVEGFTRDDILAFRAKWYVPENMLLVIVGDVDTDKLKPDIERLLGAKKPKGFFRPPRPVEPVQTEIRTALARDENTRETRFYLSFHVPSVLGGDVNALDLAADILGGRESSRLVKVIKNEKQLVNSIAAQCLTPREPGIFVFVSTLDAKNLEETAKSMMDEIAKLAAQPPTSEELDRAKVHIESQHIYANETVGGIARNMGSFTADVGDPLYQEKYLKLNQLVTEADISKVVKKYLRPPNVSITVLIPDKDRPEFQVAQLSKIVQSYVPVKTAAEAEAEAKGAVTRTLPNGIRVVLRPDDSNPVISVRIASLGGKRFETNDTKGIMNFIAEMWTKGAGSMDEDEISRRIEDMGGRLKGFSGYDSTGLSASFFSRFLDDGLGLLAEIYTSPKFPQDELERERKLIINRIKTEPDRPIHFAIRNLNEVLFPLHPYGFDKEGSLETVSGFTRDDLLQTYRRYVVPSNTVITVVGEMDVDHAMERITELFGTITAQDLVQPNIPSEEPLTKVTEKVVRIPRAKAHLAVGFRAPDLKDEDRYPLEVLNNVLAGQGGRLFATLRDKESLAYVVTSFIRPGMDPGVFAVYVASDPAKSEQAVEGIFREIDRIRKSRVEQEELSRSINNLLGHHQIALQSSWARAENTVLNTLYGLGYDYEKEYEKKITQVTADQVLDAARKYLDPERCVIVKILPEENKQAKGE